MVERVIHSSGGKMKIEFYSTVAGVYETFPVTPAIEKIPNWMSLAKQDYLQNKMQQTVYKCPGIVDVMQTGFIVSAWHDIEVWQEANGRLQAKAPTPDLEDMLGFPTTQIQGGDMIAKHLPKRTWSHRDLLKINTPWHVVAPRGIKLLMVPVPYADDNSFESTIGILDPAISNEINIQGYINSLGVIKAGTPLVQIIPLTEKKYQLVVREITEYDRNWVNKKKFLNNFSFMFSRNKTKDAYLNHYTSKCPFKKFF